MLGFFALFLFQLISFLDSYVMCGSEIIRWNRIWKQSLHI